MNMLAVMRQAAREAGGEIMKVYRSEFDVYTKDDESPLTEADLRADRVIRLALSTHFPDIFIWSEESESDGDRDQRHFFLVDPLDGTKEFLKRNGEFTVNIAYIVDGAVSCSVVYVPALDEMFYADRSTGAWLEAGGVQTALKVVKPSLDEELQVLGSRSHGADALATWLNALGRPYSLVPAGSSLKFCRLAQGLAHLYPRFGPTCQWDTAAGQGIVEMAGGVVVDHQLQAFTYDLARDKLNPNFFAASSLELLANQ